MKLIFAMVIYWGIPIGLFFLSYNSSKNYHDAVRINREEQPGTFSEMEIIRFKAIKGIWTALATIAIIIHVGIFLLLNSDIAFM